MSCTRPLYGWWSKERAPSGKRTVVFDLRAGYHDRPVAVPCGKCPHCLLEKSRQWAVRCVHEASLYNENSFVTLTYDDESIPKDGLLSKRDLKNFVKRVSYNVGKSVRYFACGEYGSRNGRPHYHCLLFGFDFADKSYWSVRGSNPVWRSSDLEKWWPKGQSEIGSVTFESAAYCARYILKGKDHVEEDLEVDTEVAVDPQGQAPPFTVMSRRPGIGREWIERYALEVLDNDSVIVRGKECKPPRYYDGALELLYPGRMDEVKRARKRRIVEEEQRPGRMAAREKVLKARLSLYEKEGVI